MTRVFALLSCLILLLGLCIGVSAADSTRAYNVNLFATVSSDGSCEVTTTVTLHVDSPKSDLVWPVPLESANVTLNGSPVLTKKTAQSRLVDLHKILGNISGDFSFTIGYTVPSAVSVVVSETEETEETTAPETEDVTPQRLLLQLPLLAGFAYPIDELQFSINLPGFVGQKPTFVSGYHQANIEKDLSYTISGGNIAGRSGAALKDHETLSMHLYTTEEMFPQSRVELPSAEKVTTLIGICAGIALLYWLLFLRNLPSLRSYPAVAPEGFGAGQMGTVLTMAGADLGLMAFSWAQLGYVTLRMDRRGRVFIYKRMEMGNERTAFERKCFHLLFARRDIVDTASLSFQRLYQTIQAQRSAPQLFRTKGSGHTKVFRVIVAVAGLLSGMCFGILLGNMLDYGWFFMLVLSFVGLLCSWHIQFWPEGLFLHHRSRLWIAALLAALWLILGLSIGQFSSALLAVSIQVLAGFLATFGGRRTEDGRAALGQALSLSRFLRTIGSQQIQQICVTNPEFFFDMAPYALAMGCDDAFARHFGKRHLSACPYLQVSDANNLTARQWSQIMRQVLTGMTARQRMFSSSNLRSVMDNYMK